MIVLIVLLVTLFFFTVAPGEDLCLSSENVISNMGAEGYISSYVTHQANCGNADQSWLLKAAIGQKINITLYDFTRNRHPLEEADSNLCTVYATIREGNGIVTHTVCGGRGQQVVPVFMSVSNVVEIRIISKPNQINNHESQFLLKYKGTAKIIDINRISL